MPVSFSRTTRALANDNSRYAILTWLLAGLLLGIWLAWFFWATVSVTETSSTARIEVSQSAHPIVPLVAGKVIATRLSLGQHVNTNDVLLELDTRTEQLRLQEQTAQLHALPSQINALQKQIAALVAAQDDAQSASAAQTQSNAAHLQEATTATAFAQDLARRLSQIQDTDAIPLLDILRAKADLQKLANAKDALAKDVLRQQWDAKMRQHQALADIESLRREAAKLQGEFTSTQISITRLQQDIEKHRILSPASGQIGSMNPLQIGSYVNIGEKLGTVVPQRELKIIAYFPPAAVLGKIRPGQRARMRLDGFPWAQFGTLPATVSGVGAEIKDGQVQVELSPQLPKASPIVMQHGLPGTVEINIERLSPALMVLRASGQLLPKPASTGDAAP